MNRINTIKKSIGNAWKRFNRLSLLLKAFIVLLFAGGVWWSWSHLSPKQMGQTQYETEVAQKGTLVVSLTASGQISNANSGSISTQASGVVTHIYVENGQQVHQGDAIADISLDQTGEQNYSQALASYQSAKNTLDNAQISFYTLQADLFTQNKKFTDLANNSTYTNSDGSPNTSNRDLPEFIVAHNTWLASEAKYNLQARVVAQAQTSLNANALSLRESSPTIYAPITGTVTGLALQEGTVLTSQNTTTGSITSQKIASIQTQAPPMVTVNLSEIDAPNVHIGDKATITIDAFSGKTFTGQVVSIDTTGSVSSGVTSYPTTIKFDTTVDNVLANMSAEANIITDIKNDVIIVSSQAVKSQNGQSYVEVMKNGKPTQVPVETGLTTSAQTEIISGISVGDTVIDSTTTPSQTTQSSQTTSPFSRIGGQGGGATFRAVGGFGR